MTEEYKLLMKVAAERCIDIYIKYHVSQVRGLPESMRTAWHTGEDLYQEKQLSILPADLN